MQRETSTSQADNVLDCRVLLPNLPQSRWQSAHRQIAMTEKQDREEASPRRTLGSGILCHLSTSVPISVCTETQSSHAIATRPVRTRVSVQPHDANQTQGSLHRLAHCHHAEREVYRLGISSWIRSSCGTAWERQQRPPCDERGSHRYQPCGIAGCDTTARRSTVGRRGTPISRGQAIPAANRATLRHTSVSWQESHSPLLV